MGGGAVIRGIDYNRRCRYSRSMYVDEVERLSRREDLPMKRRIIDIWHISEPSRPDLIGARLTYVGGHGDLAASKTQRRATSLRGAHYQTKGRYPIWLQRSRLLQTYL